jgi:hypothetical protein
MGGRNPRIHTGFAARERAAARNDAEPQRGRAVKSRSWAHGAKCEKSLNGKIFGVANESFF